MKPSRNPFIRPAHLALASILALGSYTQAAEYVWDANNVTTGAQDGGDIAGDIWGVAGQQGNWFVTPNNNQGWADTHTATFGASAGGTYAVTVGGTINTGNGGTTAGGLNFKQSGYTLSAASAQVINLGTTSGYLTLAAGVTATIGNNVSVIKNNANNTSLFLLGSSNASNVGTLNIGSGTLGGGSVLESKSNLNVNVSRGITVDVKTGGAFTSASSIILGATGSNESGYTNTLKISGGTVNVNGNYIILGNTYTTAATSSTGEVTISSGEINLNATGGGLRFGTSNANITTNGTVNLNGGTITAAQVLEASPSGSHTSTFNFNGGELKVLSGTSYASDFIKGIDTVQIRDGGAKINTNGVNTTIGQALVHSGIGGDLATDGGLEKRGAGTLTLTNSNSYTGATAIKNGTLALGVGNDRLPTGTTVTLGDGVTNDNGILKLDSRSQQLAGLLTAGNGTSNKVVNDNAAAATLTLNIASGPNSFGGTLGGSTANENNFALTKSGNGTLELTNSNTYTGATNVTQGKLIINGNISTSSLITVDPGATLGGSGTVGKAIINGTLAVGNSPGAMNFTDTLGLNGSTVMEIDGTSGAGVTSGHDFINLTGAGAAGVLTYGGALTLDIGTSFGIGSYSWNLFDMASETGTFTTISLADQYSGSLVNTSGVWDLTSGDNTWQFTESTGVLGLTVVPEPNVAALLGGIGTLLLLRRRRA